MTYSKIGAGLGGFMLEDIKMEVRARLIPKVASMLGLILATACLAPGVVRAQANLLCNPDLTAGSGSAPQCWEHDADTLPPGEVTFEWLQNEAPAELEVFNYQPRDSRWKQTVHLKPGWYHFTASVRTENVGSVGSGANLSIMESWIVSREVKDSGYWEPVGFYLQVPKETDVVMALRLGLYSGENTGRAFFRDPSVVEVSGPGADDPHFKLETWAQPESR
jgi:hypothetical protein